MPMGLLKIQLSHLVGYTGDAIPSTIPIGKPLANVDIFIMSGGKLCGVGIPGELCIAGESLTSGYLNRPELSAENL